MQENIVRKEETTNLTQQVDLKQNQGNFEYSTEHSEVQKQSVNMNEPQFEFNNDPTALIGKKDIMTPDFTNRKKLQGRQFESEKKGIIVKENIGEFNNLGVNKQRLLRENEIPHKYDENLHPEVRPVIEKVKDSLQHAKEVVSDKLSDAQETIKTNYECMKDMTAEKLEGARDTMCETTQNLKEGLINTKENVNSKVANLVDTARTGFQDVKEMAVKNLGLDKSAEQKFADLEKKYAKFDEIKNDNTFDDCEKVEEAIRVLESIPLDPSHIHDEQIDHPEIVKTVEPIQSLTVDLPDELKAEDPNYKRAEAIKEIITVQGPDVVHHEYISEQEARECVDKAIDELDRISKDPFIQREEATNLLLEDQMYTDKDKETDPAYKRAEAIEKIIENKGPQYAETCKEDAQIKAEEAEHKKNQGTWGNVKDKVSETYHNIKDAASKMLE